MNRRASIFLQFSLGLTYFADYALLISLLQTAASFGSYWHQCLLYSIFSAPPVLMLHLSNFLERRKASQLALLRISFALATFVFMLAALTTHLNLVVLSAEIFLLALFKQLIQNFGYSFLKRSADSSLEQNHVLSNLISSRYLLMIFGASVGGYLAAHGSHLAVCWIYVGFYVTGLIFACLIPKQIEIVDSLNVEDESGEKLVGVLGPPTVVAAGCYFLAYGSFRALEYPLLTKEFGISPIWVGFAFGGYILGGLLSRLVTYRFLNGHVPGRATLTLCLGLPLLFGSVGFPSQSLPWITAQLAMCALALSLGEFALSSMLMRASRTKSYSGNLFRFQCLSALCMVGGSVLVLLLPHVESLRILNLGIQGAFFLIASFVVLSLFNVPKVGIAPLLLLLLTGTACTPRGLSLDHRKTHEIVHNTYQAALTETENEISESAKVLEKCLQRDKNCSESVFFSLSSIYVPNFSKRGEPLKKFLKISSPLEGRWDSFLKSHPFISWIYVFDVASAALRIAPATPTEMTFGKAMDFRKFEFYQSAESNFPGVAWQNKTKEDMSGTGLILIVSKAVKQRNGKILVASADIKVSSLAKGLQSQLDAYGAKTRAKGLLFFAYLKPKNHPRNLISEYATDEAEWLSVKAFNATDDNFLKVPPETKLSIQNAERKAEEMDNSAIIETTAAIGDSSYRCSVSAIRHPKVIVWVCAK